MPDDHAHPKHRPSMDVTAVVPPSIQPQRAPIPQYAIPLGSMWGKYRVDSVLGRGGGGAVYAAEDTLIGRHVALKMLPPEMAGDPALLARFKAEAQAAGRLNHPNVITIYEIAEQNGLYAIAMELASGGSVQEYLARKGSPGWKSSTRLAGEACKALIVAHEAGLIHRDIKPANLLLTKEGHVKVADFGLAKITASDVMQTQAGAIMGTPAFMSPEQCRGDKIDHRTDIYSLGCTYFAMLSGKPPFEAASSLQVMFSHCSAPIPNPCELNPDVPTACADILNKALAKNPADRYATAKEMFQDLRAVIGGVAPGNTAQLTMMDEPAIAIPPSWEQIRPKPKRTSGLPATWIIGAVAAGIAVLAAILIVPHLFSQKAQRLPQPVADVNPTPIVPPAPVQIAQAPPPAQEKPPVKAPVAVAPVAAPPLAPATKPTPPATQVATAVPQPPIPLAPVPKPPQSQPAPKLAAPVAFDPQRLKKLPLRIINSVGIDLKLIPPGKFTMGDASLADAPPHEVTLTQPFYMGMLELTQGQYDTVMGPDAGRPARQRDLPACFLTWDDAVEFCQHLNELPAEKAAGRHYRLPTEAEWEYACRAGTKTRFAFGPTLEKSRANFGKSLDVLNNKPDDGGGGAGGDRPQPPERPMGPGGRGRGPRPQPPERNDQDAADGEQTRPQRPLDPAGFYLANAWGLKDMHGSVWEWCSDFYSPTAYKDGPNVDPKGPPKGTNHVARGGCWDSPADQCASAYRNGNLQVDKKLPCYGMRLVCDVPPKKTAP